MDEPYTPTPSTSVSHESATSGMNVQFQLQILQQNPLNACRIMLVSACLLPDHDGHVLNHISANNERTQAESVRRLVVHTTYYIRN